MTESDELTSRLAGLTVMVVEDETIVSFLVEDMLTELGCAQVLHASGVSEALTLLQQRQPDAAVLDVNLAGEFAYPIAEVPEERRTDGTRQEGDSERGERVEGRGRGVGRGKKEPREREDRRRCIDIKVEELDGGPDHACEEHLTGRVGGSLAHGL